MKTKLKSSFIGQHGVVHVFESQYDAARKDINNVAAIIAQDGSITFTNEDFEETVSALVEANKLSAHKAEVGLVMLKGADYAPVPGYAYFDLAQKIDIVLLDDLQESIVESTDVDAVEEIQLQEAVEGMVPNHINMQTGVGYKLQDATDYIKDDVELVYRDAESHARASEKDVVGTFDSVKNELIIDDHKIVDRINLCALAPVRNAIGCSRIRGKDGYHIDFMNPGYPLTIIDLVDDEDKEEDGPEQQRAHFLELSDEFEEVPEKTRAVEESVNESVTTEDNMNTNPELLKGQKKEGYMSTEPEQIYKQKKVEAPAKDDADQEARMQQYLHFATSFNF